MNKCPLCQSEYNTLITQRDNISPYQNKLFNTLEAANGIQKVNFKMCMCEKCGFVFNPDFDSSIQLYDNDYNNDQNASKLFEAYIDESINYLINNYINFGAKILEIGCGKYGIYLKKMISKLNYSCSGIGYDPSYLRNENIHENKLKFVKKFYDFSNENNEVVDFIISRHVIEHIQNPKKMISNISTIIMRKNNSKAFIETPDVTWILEKGAWFDFCYEHCSFFSPTSLEFVVNEMGLEIRDLRTVFNKQYMQAIIGQKKNNNDVDRFRYRVEKLNKLALNYIEHEKKQISRYKEMLYKVSKSGVTAIWGAGAKGNTFLNVLDSKKQYISFVIDINENKSGKFISGTGHEIIMPNRIKQLEIKNILIMNNNYYYEIKNKLSEENIDINLISIEEI